MSELEKDISGKAADKIATTTFILEIHIRQPGFRKKVNTATYLAKAGNPLDVSPDVLYLAKDILERTDISYLEKHRTLFLQSLKRMSLSPGQLAIGNGQYLMPIASLENIKTLIDSYKREREKYLDQFQNEYESLVNKARVKLGGLFRDDDYPPFSDIRKRYRVDYRLLGNTLPENIANYNESLRKYEQQRLRAMSAATLAEIQQTMRDGFAALIDSFTEKLGRDQDNGKFYTLPEARFDALMEFIERFGQKNIVGDQELESLVAKAKEALSGVGIRQIKSNEDLREHLSQTFDEIKKDVQPLVLTRAIDLTEVH